nr:putative G3BP-like protein isoform X1 [Ipomoea batatas]
MATEAESPATTVPSAQIVGNAFVEQYYHILHHSPELVYKFYQDSSILSRQDPNGVISSVTTMQAINEKILSLDSKNSKAEIKTADAQDSHQAGVILLVTGCLTGRDNVRKKFTQTFFLAPQEKGYFVLNDIFRYIEENEAVENISEPVNAVNEASQAAVLPSDPEPVHAPDDSTYDPATTIASEELHNGAEVCDPSDNEEGSVIEEEVLNEPQVYSSQKETDIVDSSDPSAAQEEKKSYASIVKVTKAATRTIAYIPTSSTQVATVKSDQQALGSEKPPTEPEPLAPSNDNAPESSNAHEEGYSIYVRNLPSTATAGQLQEVFKKFGAIKHNGIQVRSNKQQGFCFGFVEFESLSAMQNAIEASPITIEGRQAVVEEKRTTTRVVGSSRGGGRYSSGRGGFRGESFRGRGNFGGGRGYGRSEFRNQADFGVRSKGRNVETYRRVDQNESGRQGGMNKNTTSA